ncbi:helix-turn-helix domain-containing protein [Maribellus mangrovi]|uniref:helix-turn-helix domain-containing protein n=1 Tax=Maribellus mangrovi TaxID=3133146 RepID=UPI0030EC068F
MSSKYDNNQFLRTIHEIIVDHIKDEKFGVTELANISGLNRTLLYKKIKKYTGKSVSQFIIEVRLNIAKELLQDQSKNVSEVAYDVGFNSPSYFNTCYKKRFGVSPGEVQKNLLKKEEADITDTDKKPFLKSTFLVPAIIIAILFIGYIIISSATTRQLSIAVLPPNDISQDGNECIILEGFREEIQNKLIAVDEIRIVPLISTNAFRNSDKSIAEIGKELNTDFFVTISGQSNKDATVLRIHLINSKKDADIWSKTINIKNENKALFQVQQEAALNLIEELDIALSGREKKEIIKQPTENRLAYYYYQLGLKHMANWQTTDNPEHYLEAKRFFELAVSSDTTFADAYAKLGSIYINELSGTAAFKALSYFDYENYLDSGMLMLNKAVQYHIRDIDEVLYQKIRYHQFYGHYETAITQFNQLWKNKTKNHTYYFQLAELYYFQFSYYKALKNYFAYFDKKPTDHTIKPSTLTKVMHCLIQTGFPEEATEYAKIIAETSLDSLYLTKTMAYIQYCNGNFREAEELYSSLCKNYLNSFTFYENLRTCKLFLGKLNEAYQMFPKYNELSLQYFKQKFPDVISAYLYQKFGDTEKAKWEYNKIIEMLKMDMDISKNPFHQNKFGYITISECYALRGDNDMAINHLKVYAKQDCHLKYWLVQIKHAPHFKKLYSNEKFINTVEAIEIKFQKDHKKVRKLLQRNRNNSPIII